MSILVYLNTLAAFALYRVLRQLYSVFLLRVDKPCHLT